MVSKKAISKWTMNGITRNAPLQWQEAEALATFDRDAVQASLSVEKMTFVNDEAIELINYIASGRIFEGIPYKIQLQNKNNQTIVFDGMIDLSDGCEINEFNNKVTAKLRLRDELYTLEEKLQALSFGYLESLGVFTSGDYKDIHYVVIKKFNLLETITMSITIYLITKELIDTVMRLPKDISNASSLVATGGLTSVLAGIIYTLAVAILEIAYAASLLIALVKISSTLISQLVPIKRKGKCLNFRTAMTKVCAHLGYTFQSNITDLDNVYYLPSNYSFDSTTKLGIIDQWKGNKKGIPATTDYGYNCVEFFETAKKLFYGKFAIVNGVVCFYNSDDPYWYKYSTYKVPSVRDKIKTFNCEDLTANRLFTFDVDNSDEWTIDDYKGNSYEVITDAIITTDKKLKNIRKFEEVRFGACLATRKDSLSDIENALLEVASVIDGIIKFLGGSPKFVNMIKSSIGVMKISTNNWMKPKIIKLNSTKLVDRSLWSAKYIYETYYKGKSFISTINGIKDYGQKIVYRNVRIPFGLDDFITLINNSYFILPDGKQGKIISCKYKFDADTANVDYYIHESYASNLKEIFVEPSNID